jgi:O-antigen/teichoic acid export membrane protein
MAITSVLAGSGAWTVGEMVRAQWSDLDYALYAIGLQWYAIGLFVPGMLMIVLFPLQVRAAGPNANSVSETRRLLVQGGIPMLIASAAMLLVALPLSPLLVRFYGPSFEGESWIIWGFIAAAGAAAPATLLGNNLVAAGRQLEWTAYTAVWLAVLVASSFVAVRAGARFTPAAFIIASTVLTGLSAWAVLRSRPGGAALPDPR